MNYDHVPSFLTYLQSQASSREFLHHCYKRMAEPDAEMKSYENASVFMAYLEHGLIFYKQGKAADARIKPLLYFYGMVHLVKACILAQRPDYPESTAHLAHGVSARKRKKKNYSFLEDEVKVQHRGLLPYMSKHLFDMDTLPFSKISMNHLLQMIPELSPFYAWQGRKTLVKVGKMGDRFLYFPETLLDDYHLTERAFFAKIKTELPLLKTFEKIDSSYQVELFQPFNTETGAFFINQTDGGIFFPTTRQNTLAMPEVVIHYLVLYNLSMLSRYEPGWWGEVLSLKPDMDDAFIKRFLDTTADKMPYVLGLYLQNLYKTDES
ncbi:uncharacterized protein JNUCC1_01763 [Lentibacillus sp. JNUCC-1]|uniref:YaaC family protein n=1 Tax=Lentibacillus sp. JNUCC-1 TaxID=2654513 RepID=UPI0012E8B68A|nr:YaaC family protein [Lentibacillus sp. JNUCC-1]MUV37957.1 uncharacterized protein [Lentibacillus sp. JNUCC-1]